MDSQDINLIAIGTSSGGKKALTEILSGLPDNFPIPIVVVQHVHKESEGYHIHQLQEHCKVTIGEANDKEVMRPGTVYFAPPNYHLLSEPGGSLCLSVSEKVNHARPSIDVLFESAARYFGKGVVGVILTGANADGSDGIKAVKKAGGVTIVQNPLTAEYELMPTAAIASTEVDHILDLGEISPLLVQISKRGKHNVRSGKCPACR